MEKTWTVNDGEKCKDLKPITSKWVLNIKDNGKYNARLVVRRCQQRRSIDYEETYSPVVSTNSIRVLLALSAMRNYYVITMDVKTAFLYGDLEEEI